MAVGKSTVGRLLARRWGADFVDLDVVIGDIPAIFRTEGEAGFRRRESAALAATVSAGPAVLALGGGTLVAAQNRALLADWPVVVLMASVETLRARLGSGGSRPLAPDMERLLLERTPVWSRYQPWFYTDSSSPEALVDTLVRHLEAA